MIITKIQIQHTDDTLISAGILSESLFRIDFAQMEHGGLLS